MLNFPLVAAERVVDWPQLDKHILDARAGFDRYCWPTVRDYVQALVLNDGIPSRRAKEYLERRVFIAASRTYRFGYDTAILELGALRSRRPSRPGLVASEIPDHPDTSPAYCRKLANAAVTAITKALDSHYPSTTGESLTRLGELEEKGRGYLHNAGMELVGYALNAGRTLAALGGDEPVMTGRVAPALWAMRSEQLDRSTCRKCKRLHGTVVRVGTKRYFDLMPPKRCVTATIKGIGARCRGIYVYGDSEDDFLE
jgi:hypothetical protein